MKFRSILVAAVLAFGFATSASALTNQNAAPAHQYANSQSKLRITNSTRSLEDGSASWKGSGPLAGSPNGG